MTSQENKSIQFLEQLNTLTDGDTMAQQSMYDVGSALGWHKDQSGKIAEDLIGQGLVEIKTLSGGIGITPDGVAAIQATNGITGSTGPLTLGNGPVLDAQGCATVERMVNDIKTILGQNKTIYPQMEEMVIDIKTIDTQMLSPQPKVAVIQSLFRSLQQALSSAGFDDMADQMGRVADG